MKLSLEQIVVLASTPEWPTSKQEIIRSTYSLLEGHYIVIEHVMDSLVWSKYIEKNSGMYNLRPEGLKALKEGAAKLQDIMGVVFTLIKAKE